MPIIHRPLVISAIAVALFGCSKESGDTKAAPSASAPEPTTPPKVASAAPSASASAAPEPPHDCPAGSSGVGSLAKPCEAKGADRLMTVKWTKTTDDLGPEFSITNKSKLVILYGKIAVYFYDKAGKQLDATPDTSENPPKARHFHTCSGTFFQGVMKPAENAALTFSCVPKKAIPEGTATIEAEMPMVGFADSTEKKVDFYWRNPELSPDVRKKGGGK